MMKREQVRRGTVCRHHSGRVYTILSVLNGSVPETTDFPHMVSYVGANGNEWTRRVDDFVEKFTVLYDGSQLAP